MASKKSRSRLFPAKWLAIIGVLVIAFLTKNSLNLSQNSPLNIIRKELVTASETKRVYYTKYFTLKYPSNWFADEFPNDNDPVRFQISDIENSPVKLAGKKSEAHPRISVNYVPGAVPRCYTTDGNGNCPKHQNQPYSVNGYTGFFGEQEVSNGTQQIVYLKNPVDEDNYLSLVLTLPTKENQKLSQDVFNQILSSINFTGSTGNIAPIQSSISNPTGQVGSARLDLFTKSVSIELSGTSLAVSNKNYLTNINNFSVYSDPSHDSDDGYKYTTLETSWTENDAPMRIYFYFKYRPGDNWQLYELRSYDGNQNGEWIYYPTQRNGKPIVEAPLGSKFIGSEVSFSSGSNKIRFGSLTVQAFRDISQ